ncbi:PldB Lysophospholipase [Rhabdaerophilaceae bacterium]
MIQTAEASTPPPLADHPDGVGFRVPYQLTWCHAADGVRLRAAFWQSPQPERPTGTVLVVQGRSEFVEKYREVIGELGARGFATVAFDWRGQGRSTRQLGNLGKGHVEDFDDYLLDLDAIIGEMTAREMPKPWTILAHSMGAAVALLALARGPSPFVRAMLSAPMVGLNGWNGSFLARMIARTCASLGLAHAFVPTGRPTPVPQSAPFATNPLTSDERRYGVMCGWLDAAPSLGIGDPTIGWVDAAFNAMQQFQNPEFGRVNRTPIMMILAGKDSIVSTKAAARLAHTMRGASCITLPGIRHEVLMERDEARNLFWRAFDEFVIRSEEQASHREQTNPVNPPPFATEMPDLAAALDLQGLPSALGTT